MISKRKKHLNLRLPPRVDAYPKKDGTFSFRFKHWDSHYIPLGNDIEEARKQGYALNAGQPIKGTIADLIAKYWEHPWFTELKPRTKIDYEDHSKHVLRVFGQLDPKSIKKTDLSRYLRKERAEAPIRANKEIKGFLSSVFNVGIDLGIVEENPCHGVLRNTERARNRNVETWELSMVITIAEKIGPSAQMIALAAEFSALAGRRRQDILKLPMPKADDEFIRVVPQKVKPGETAITIEIPLTPGLLDVIERVKAVHRRREQEFEEREVRRAEKGRVGKEKRPIRSMAWLFCNQQGQPYSDAGFKTMWNKIQVRWAKEGGQRFTFHDLRAYYVTEAKARGWQVADTTGHKDEATADKIYDRRRVRKARPLK